MKLDEQLAKCRSKKQKEQLKIFSFAKDYTLLEALAEIYAFNPRKKKESQIMFEITDEDSDSWLRFGKNWNAFDREWHYLEWEKYGPCCGQVERHFVSNLMTNDFARENLHYSAQQGSFLVKKIFDSRIDTKWRNRKDNKNY